MNERILITSALPYVNGVKHLGNLAGSILPADVHARFRRQRGDEILFICGTDDHGTPAEIAAERAGIPTRQFCDQQYAKQADIYRRFDISFDRFGRTSDRGTSELVIEFYHALDAAGAVEEREIVQAWSETDRRFLPDRYVVGECPHCGGDKAKGDQCEGCGRLLDPQDLVNPRSAISGARDIAFRSTKHLFLRQSQYVEAIRRWVDGKTDWPPVVRSIALSWLNEGLKDRCITRDLSWGISVPRDGFEGKVFYVWFDAPIGYIGITKDWSDEYPRDRDWRRWWSDENTRYIQFLAKDNVPFHAVSFPCSQIASGLPYRLVDTIKGYNWLTYKGGKFSTSEGKGVFTDDALDILPADYWRWWLTANAPESSDSDFSFSRFAEGCNSDLADNFGNLASRVLSFASKRNGGLAPEPSVLARKASERLLRLLEEVEKRHTGLESRKAADAVRAVWSEANRIVVECEPWAAYKRSSTEGDDALSASLCALRASALAAWAIIPSSSEKVLAALGQEGRCLWPERAACLEVEAGSVLTRIETLFPKVDADLVVDLETRFG